jgi:sugar/nucleoside kinase (ribokinase family)
MPQSGASGHPAAEPNAGLGVLVVGDIMTDIIVKPQGPIARGSDCPAAIRMRPGGSGANQAAWLRHFGVAVTFVAKVGHSDLDDCRQMMLDLGVTPRILGDLQTATGLLVTLVDPDGQRSFLTDRGANAMLEQGDLSDDLFDGAALLHVSGYALFAERSRLAVLDLARRARERDIPVTVDPASASFLEDVGPAAFLQWTNGAAICFPNDDEAAILTGTRDEASQRRMLSAHYGLVVIKRGSFGAELVDPGGERLLRLPAPEVAVVDTTGAGDAFLAGFLAAYLTQASQEECLRRGIAAGAAATTVFGGRPPTLQQSRSSEK